MIKVDGTLECCGFVLLNCALSIHCALIGTEKEPKGDGTVVQSRCIVVGSKYALLVVLIFIINVFIMLNTWLFEAILFPLTLVMLYSLFFPYLKSPSPLLSSRYDIVDREVSTIRRWHHYLVWSNIVYILSGAYSISCQQYVFGAVQFVTGFCSALYHLHKESCYFNLDNIFATMCLFSYLYTWTSSFEYDMIFFFFGMLGMPVAAFVIIGCGLPADIVRLRDADGENPPAVPAAGNANGNLISDIDNPMPEARASHMRTRSRAKQAAEKSDSTAAAVKALRVISEESFTVDPKESGAAAAAMRTGRAVRVAADGGDSICCLDITTVRRNPRPLYDTVHALWHLVSALGPVQCTWFAQKYVLTEANSEAALGVLGAGYLDSAKLFPTLPVLSFVLSVCVNIFLNIFEFGPFE